MMDKEELMKTNKEYIDHLKSMESLAKRMDRNYLYMDNFGLFCFSGEDKSRAASLLVMNMLRQEGVFDMVFRCVISAVKLKKMNPDWIGDMHNIDNEIEAQEAVDAFLKSNGMKREGQ